MTECKGVQLAGQRDNSDLSTLKHPEKNISLA